MSITASSIIRRVVETIQDPTSIRWPVAELVRYLNDAQREIVMYRPDAMTTTATWQLSQGSRQTLPANGTKLIDLVRNSTGARKPTREVNREILDAQIPNWHTLTPTAEVLHYTYDPRDPRTFYVYPPSNGLAGTAMVDVVYSALPTDIVEPADGSLYSAVQGNISVPDIFANTIQDYIMYRLYNKDSEYAGNVARAQAAYASFANALGVEIKATLAVAPNPAGTPNRTTTSA